MKNAANWASLPDALPEEDERFLLVIGAWTLTRVEAEPDKQLILSLAAINGLRFIWREGVKFGRGTGAAPAGASESEEER